MFDLLAKVTFAALVGGWCLLIGLGLASDIRRWLAERQSRKHVAQSLGGSGHG